MESDFLMLQLGVVTDLGRLIPDQRMRSFYFSKLYFKFELFDLNSMVKIYKARAIFGLCVFVPVSDTDTYDNIKLYYFHKLLSVSTCHYMCRVWCSYLCPVS
jgi:hypothetical protein